MELVQFCLTFLLMSGYFRVQATPPHPMLGPVGRSAKHSSGDEGGDGGKGTQPRPQKHNSTEGYNNSDNHTVIVLEDIVTSLDGTTFAQITHLQLSIPIDLDFGNMNPDFSRMILNMNSSIKSMEIEGDYKLFVENDVRLPAYGQGNIYIKFSNVTVLGRTLLALTPAALLALEFDFAYTAKEVSAKVVPISEITSAQEVYLSKDIVSGTLASLISKEVEEQLGYYVEMHIHLALSKINVFTIGHRNEQPATKEQLTQNVQIGDLFDEMLADVRKDILENRKDEIDIPSFHRNFSEKLESVVINGTFKAEEGWIIGLSEFKRFSNVTLAKSGDKFILSAMLEFEDLQMGYDKYVATFLKSKLVGELDGHFIHRQFTLKVAMDPKEDGTCTSALHEIKLFKTNGYRIQEITNIGSFEWLHIRINNWLIGYFKTQIAKDIEKVLSAAVRNSLSGFDCGEYLPSFKIF
jgi:translation initiation factor 2 beta subunit (eIF-2beta)/eIF-5